MPEWTKGDDLGSSGLMPRRFESCFVQIWQRVRVVKESVLKTDGVSPRRFESCRCRFEGVV